MARGMMDSKQKGMAMLTALLVVAIASALATSLWYGTALDMARMHNIQQAYQAKHLSQGLMLWASDVLKKDYEESDLPWDNNNDNWLQGIKQIPADGTIMSGGLVGLSDCFNVNNLWRNGEVSENHYQYFKRLLNLLSVDVAVAEQAIDWIDADQISRPQGAEDFAYLASSPSYQTGSQAFWHESQLKLLQAVTPEIYDVIHPYVCVLPAQSRVTKMNINTLPPIMIRALNPSISEALALSVYQDGSASFSQLNAFYEHSEMSIITSRAGVKEQLTDLLSVQTRYIQAEAEVLMESSVHDSYILLRRGGDGAAVALQRAQSPFRLLDAVE
ncbi:type II secretion system minor pseudopilin GspK [Marinicella rhabdoformis]|uniref:type II secretion system minor pseudopilin GspK n=1 Tax=Marinicella rhabdoformis TaxID=2580566 RepID=UPI0012AEDB8C|nr:type II secretion system minor pseudopilin GspK [Marinicella rhabdoformis]